MKVPNDYLLNRQSCKKESVDDRLHLKTTEFHPSNFFLCVCVCVFVRTRV